METVNCNCVSVSPPGHQYAATSAALPCESPLSGSDYSTGSTRHLSKPVAPSGGAKLITPTTETTVSTAVCHRHSYGHCLEEICKL